MSSRRCFSSGIEAVMRSGPAPKRRGLGLRELWRLARLSPWLLSGLVGQQRLIEEWIRGLAQVMRWEPR